MTSSTKFDSSTICELVPPFPGLTQAPRTKVQTSITGSSRIRLVLGSAPSSASRSRGPSTRGLAPPELQLGSARPVPAAGLLPARQAVAPGHGMARESGSLGRPPFRRAETEPGRLLPAGLQPLWTERPGFSELVHLGNHGDEGAL